MRGKTIKFGGMTVKLPKPIYGPKGTWAEDAQPDKPWHFRAYFCNVCGMKNYECYGCVCEGRRQPHD